jgi:hypothetical protein
MVRALWTVVVVCLMAATGVQPARAAEHDRLVSHAQLAERAPQLPTVTAARHAAPQVATRPAPADLELPPGLVATWLAPPPPAVHALAAATGRRVAITSSSLCARSARGPPAR